MLKSLMGQAAAGPTGNADCADANTLVIDVRSPGEYASGHVDGALNVPLDRIEADLPALAPDKGQAILLCCASGMRSGMALRALQAMGYQAAVNGGAAGALALQLQRPIRRL
ncbi:rhodanese-like domain-containing protein [Paucibacter sp. KBW04]|uniref:rhodanese-like domain-containing protein n=1 Tax=Paucibacter sp. KBW04 TaxID=2153361 RepID=UPI001E45A616|nr:rhodanese-like domain-containing protein [Paucibacter sp. KBW04]